MSDQQINPPNFNQPSTSTANAIQWIPSKRGRNQPYLNGYNYRMISKGSNGTTYWTCCEKTCHAKLHTFSDGSHMEKGEHLHGGHHVEVTRKQLNYDLKTKAKNDPHQKMKEVYKEVVNSLAQRTDVNQTHRSMVLNKGYSSFKMNMHRARAEKLPPLPTLRSELVILPEQFSKFTHEGQEISIVISNEIVGSLDDTNSSLESEANFSSSNQPTVPTEQVVPVQNDSDSDDDELSLMISNPPTVQSSSTNTGEIHSQSSQVVSVDQNINTDDELVVVDENRCIILGLSSNLEYLNHTVNLNGQIEIEIRLFADGTFQVCPKMFAQLYTIHARVRGKLFPIVYALLPNKQSITYEHMLKVIKNKLFLQGIDWSPPYFQIDYELSMINAIKSILPNTRIRGCYFHYTQAIIRKISSSHLITYYRLENHEVRKIVKTCLVLPLIPIGKIAEGVTIIQNMVENVAQNQPYKAKVESFFKYLQRTWTGREGRTPLFPKEMWSQYDVFKDRSNNRLEAFHRNLNQTIASHANIWKFLNHILKNLQAELVEIQTLNNGGEMDEQESEDQALKNSTISFYIEEYVIGNEDLATTLNLLTEVIGQ